MIDKRWSVSAAYGVAVARARTDGAEARALADVQLALHFRVIAELQLGLAIGGAVDNQTGYAGLYVDARYSLAAERRWSPFLCGGLGIGGSNALFATMGVGLARRFVSWEFAADLHVHRLGSDDEARVADELEHFGVIGAGLGIGARYHWGGGKNRRRFVP